jgi:hypothetical protein
MNEFGLCIASSEWGRLGHFGHATERAQHATERAQHDHARIDTGDMLSWSRRSDRKINRASRARSRAGGAGAGVV